MLKLAGDAISVLKEPSTMSPTRWYVPLKKEEQIALTLTITMFTVLNSL